MVESLSADNMRLKK